MMERRLRDELERRPDRRRGEIEEEHGADDAVEPVPGKRSLTEELPVGHHAAPMPGIPSPRWRSAAPYVDSRTSHAAGLTPFDPGAPPRRIDRHGDGAVQDEAPARIAEALAGAAEPLPTALRRRLERAIGVDLGPVRIRTGEAAARAADAVGADAFAIGQDIVFAAGRYQPDGEEGVRLIAHEVAHTVQQAAAPALAAPGAIEVSRPGDAGELEADRVADAVVRGERAPAPAPVTGAEVMRQWNGEELPPGSDAGGEEIAQTREGRSVQMFHFEGAEDTSQKILIIGGMHGDERGGIEVVDIILEHLRRRECRPLHDVWVIPTLFPDNVVARRDARDRPSLGRRESPALRGRGYVDPNRNLPRAGTSGAAHRATEQGRQGGREELLPENAGLVAAIERIRPTRIVQVHSTNARPDEAGFSRDEQTGRDPTADAAATQEDHDLSLRMADDMSRRGHDRSVEGNELRRNRAGEIVGGRSSWSVPTRRGQEPPRTLGRWGGTAVDDAGGRRDPISVITVETRGDRASFDRGAAPDRRHEMESLAMIIEEHILGGERRESTAPTRARRASRRSR